MTREFNWKTLEKITHMSKKTVNRRQIELREQPLP